MNVAKSATPSFLPLLDTDPFRKCRDHSIRKQAELHELLSTEVPRYTSEDTSLVVFGSLARGEWTSGSDLDWTYLIDGQANSDHLKISQQIEKILKRAGFVAPGPTGTFGNMAFSHDIIHQIGGHDDTNRNMTQRILLLLESRPIGNRTEAYERVLRAVINRYLEEDSHPLTRDSKRFRVPRFLVNDIVRFWRTMAVDFASKQRDRGGEGWGLRNAKLRMSRKLIFAFGLLICFDVNLNSLFQTQISTAKDDIKPQVINHIRNLVRFTPLEILARSMHEYGTSEATAKELFDAYAEFLNVLDDASSREALKKLRAENSRNDPLFQRVREISAAFERALNNIFFENKSIAPLTKTYGVF